MRKFLKAIITRFFENVLSAKMWFFLLPLTIPSYILFGCLKENTDILNKAREVNNIELMKFAVTSNIELIKMWLTAITSLTGVVIVVRETFKINRIAALSDMNKKEEIEKMHS